jgi:hypothetical protein
MTAPTIKLTSSPYPRVYGDQPIAQYGVQTPQQFRHYPPGTILPGQKVSVGITNHQAQLEWPFEKFGVLNLTSIINGKFSGESGMFKAPIDVANMAISIKCTVSGTGPFLGFRCLLINVPTGFQVQKGQDDIVLFEKGSILPFAPVAPDISFNLKEWDIAIPPTGEKAGLPLDICFSISASGKGRTYITDVNDKRPFVLINETGLAEGSPAMVRNKIEVPGGECGLYLVMIPIGTDMDHRAITMQLGIAIRAAEFASQGRDFYTVPRKTPWRTSVIMGWAGALDRIMSQFKEPKGFVVKSGSKKGHAKKKAKKKSKSEAAKPKKKKKNAATVASTVRKSAHAAAKTSGQASQHKKKKKTNGSKPKKKKNAAHVAKKAKKKNGKKKK